MAIIRHNRYAERGRA